MRVGKSAALLNVRCALNYIQMADTCSVSAQATEQRKKLEFSFIELMIKKGVQPSFTNSSSLLIKHTRSRTNSQNKPMQVMTRKNDPQVNTFQVTVCGKAFTQQCDGQAFGLTYTVCITTLLRTGLRRNNENM